MRLANKEDIAGAMSAAVLATLRRWSDRVARNPRGVDWSALQGDLRNAITPHLASAHRAASTMVVAAFDRRGNDAASEADANRWAADYARELSTGVIANIQQQVDAAIQRENGEAALYVYLLMLMGSTAWSVAETRIGGAPALRIGGQMVPHPRDSAGELIRSEAQTIGGGRARMIGTTETNRAQSAGMKQGGDVLREIHGLNTQAVWAHFGPRPPGHCGAAVRPCKTCTPLEGRSIRQIGFFPPAHPGCDCDVNWDLV